MALVAGRKIRASLAAHGLVRIPRSLDQRLTRIAKRTGRAKAYYASKALERYLEDMEDHLLAAASLEEMKSKGKKRGRSLEQVAKRLGLAGKV
jgi:RHH-type rel operon transcriptional repressor/antitoxin RelB